MPLKILILLTLFFLPLVPTFWAIRDIPGRQFATDRKRVIWLLVVSTLPFVGALIYIGFVRRHTKPLEIESPT